MKNALPVRRSPRRIASSHLMEQLESRMLMSANITASVSNGVLSLLGNSSNHNVIISQNSLAAGQFSVSPGDSVTTINGKAAPIVYSGVTGLTVNLGSGNDTIAIQNATVTNNVQITGASSNQVVNLTGVIIDGNFSLTNTGGQNSTSVQNSTIDGSVTINAGAGFNSQCGSFWGCSTFSNANEIFTLANSTVFTNVAISNTSGETTTDIESSTIGNNLTVTDGANSYGNCGFNCHSNSSSLSGDLFTLNASTVGNNVSISNASDGNSTTIEGGSSITGNLAVSNVVGTSNQSCFSISCSANLANAGDSFALTGFSSVDGNVSIANVSDGATADFDAVFIGGSLTVNNGVGSYGQGFTSACGQNSENSGDFFTLADGSFVGTNLCITNGSTYNNTDVDSSFIGGNLAVSNGLNLTSQNSGNSCGGNYCCGGNSNAVLTTDLVTINGGFIGGNLSVTNASGFTSTTIEGNSFITNNATLTNATGTAIFVMSDSTIGYNLTFIAGKGSTSVTVTTSTIGNNATLSVAANASIVFDPSQVGNQLTL